MCQSRRTESLCQPDRQGTTEANKELFNDRVLFNTLD